MFNLVILSSSAFELLKYKSWYSLKMNVLPLRLKQSILIGLFVYYLCIPNSFAQRFPISKIADNDYLGRCGMFTNGRLTHFNKSTISVFIAPISVSRNLTDVYRQILIESFQQWEIATGLEFSFISDKKSANIHILWNHHRQIGGLHPHGGESVLIRPDPNGHRTEIQVEIEIFVRQAKQIDFLQPEDLRTILLHEIGHAIGLWGHSSKSSDIMYYQPVVKKLSARDVATVNQLLKEPVGSSLHQSSLKALKTALTKQANIAEHLYAIGLIHMDLGDYELAMSVFQKAITINPLAKKVAWQMAQIRQQDSDYELALKDYFRSVDGQPTAKKLGAIGTTYILQGNYDLALTYLGQALRADPESELLRRNMVAAYHHKALDQRQKGEKDAAVQTLNEGLKDFPNSSILLYDLGSTYGMMKLYNRAFQVYEDILQIKPNHIDALISIAATLNNLGVEVAGQQKWEKAMDYYRKSLDYDVNCWEAQHNLVETLLLKGWKYLKQEDYSKATKTFSEVIEHDSKNASAYYNLGISLYSQGQIKSANEAFDHTLELNPNHSDAQDYLREINEYEKGKKLERTLPIILALLSFSLVIALLKRKKNEQKSTC